MLNDGHKCSSKCPLMTSPLPLPAPPSFDHRSYQLHCLAIKPSKVWGEVVSESWKHRLLELEGPWGLSDQIPNFVAVFEMPVSRRSIH